MTSPFTRLSQITSCLFLGIVFLLPLTSFAEEMVGPPAPSPPPDEHNALDRSRDYLSDQFVDFVAGIDRFFGDDRHYQEANDSVVQLDLIRVTGYGGANKPILSGRAKVHLPIAEKKLHLLIETNPDKNATVDPARTLSPALKQPSTTESYAAALRIEKIASERWHFSADGGMKFAGLHTTPFVRTRASLSMPVNDWRLKVTGALFWFNTVGTGESTQLDMEHPVNIQILFRASSYVSWLRNTKNFDLRQDLSFIHQLDERNALLYQFSVLGVSRPEMHVTDYVVLGLYRYRLHREWMFFEFSPQLHFPEARNYRLSPLLMLRMEFLFDDTK